MREFGLLTGDMLELVKGQRKLDFLCSRNRPPTGIGYVVKRLLNRDSPGQPQKADRGSTTIQAGRDV